MIALGANLVTIILPEVGGSIAWPAYRSFFSFELEQGWESDSPSEAEVLQSREICLRGALSILALQHQPISLTCVPCCRRLLCRGPLP